MNHLSVNLVVLFMSALSSTCAGRAQAGEGMTKETVAAEAVWTRAVKPPASPPARIVLEGLATEDGFRPTAVSFPERGPGRRASTALVPGSDILPLLDIRPFGLEERVDYSSSGEGLTMRCMPGRQPAGLVLGSGSLHFPRGLRSELIVSADTKGDIGISVVEAGADAPAEPMAMLGAGQAALTVPLARWSAEPQLHDLVLTCPPSASAAVIRSIVIGQEQPVEPERAAGTWIWQPEVWGRGADAVAASARTTGLQRVYLQLRIEDGIVAQSRALAALVERLGRDGVEVHAVEGDPAMAIEAGRENALARVAAIARYQADAPRQARLAGLQFDIEPYLLEAYSRDAGALWREWAESIGLLAQEWGAPLSVVVPFWMRGEDFGLAALDSARSAISQVVVMAYRTAPEEVFVLSEPWLSWGSAHDLPIAIALENGWLPTELHQTYVRSKTGTLILSYRNGEGQVTLLSDHIREPDEGFAYALSHEVRVKASRISFMNNRRQLADARSRLSRLLGAWSSFDGLMLHELDGPERRSASR